MSEKVVLETSLGKIELELDSKKAPKTVANFLAYLDSGFYDGTIFHRVIPNFMIQGGGFEPGLKQKSTKDSIQNESSNGLSNLRGTIAMARTSAPHSASSQFFINVKDNLFLDKSQAADGHGYCVFGKVTNGLDVLDSIKMVPTGNKAGHGDVPLSDVKIIKASRA
jgi:cyclophilin family peptidyl-prolyl cis-trans isomerase